VNAPVKANAKQGAVQLMDVMISYGKDRVVHGITLDVRPGEFVCLLGPSGCGKTTTLRAIAGLASVESGTVSIDGKVANLLPAHRRGIGMVFQDLALFPHMSVYQNVAFGLALRGVDPATTRVRVADMLRLLHLAGFEDRLPRQLSGGQQQRVALARSLVVNPSVLLLDEPFAALDRKLREDMRREIRALQQQLGITAIFVTHDQEEALTMADRVVVMNAGVIEQVGTPSEVYETPVNRFVLSFVGYSNFLRAEVLRNAGGSVRCEVAGTTCTLGTRTIGGAHGGTVEIAIRPERIRLATGRSDADGVNRIQGTVRGIAYEGAILTYDIVLADGQLVLAREPNAGDAGLAPRHVGERVEVAWSPADAVLIR
jgi:putative spermidine/putrescine transport system ATP-binding protein